jgi:hypothetical protein
MIMIRAESATVMPSQLRDDRVNARPGPGSDAGASATVNLTQCLHVATGTQAECRPGPGTSSSHLNGALATGTQAECRPGPDTSSSHLPVNGARPGPLCQSDHSS